MKAVHGVFHIHIMDSSPWIPKIAPCPTRWWLDMTVSSRFRAMRNRDDLLGKNKCWFSWFFPSVFPEKSPMRKHTVRVPFAALRENKRRFSPPICYTKRRLPESNRLLRCAQALQHGNRAHQHTSWSQRRLLESVVSVVDLKSLLRKRNVAFVANRWFRKTICWQGVAFLGQILSKVSSFMVQMIA